MSDMELLRQYAEWNSESAFATLISRHINLVYSAAFRKTSNTTAAEEITQVVFVILAKKAGHIPSKTILPGWLYQTARLTASSFLRSEARRARREQEAYMQTELHTAAPDETWNQLVPLLEDAMGRLGEKERAAVVLRYFGGKSFAEVAMTFGITENAAKKRVSHALEKLHRHFNKRGVASTTSIIAGVISANSVQAAPAALAKSVTVAAVAKGATASGSTLTLIKGTLKLMAWTKVKAAALVGAALLLGASTAMTLVIQHQSHAQIGAAKVVSAGQTNGLMVNITSRFMVIPDAFIGKLGITWEPAQSGGMISVLDKTQTDAVMQALKQIDGVVELPSPPRMATDNGVGVKATRTKLVKVADTNANIGIILQITPLYSDDYSSLELSLTNELHELVDVSGRTDVQRTMAVATASMKARQTIVIRQPVAEGQMLGKTIGKSSSVVAFISPSTFIPATGLRRIK